MATKLTLPKRDYPRTLVLDQSSTTVGYAVVEETPEHSLGYGVYGRLIRHGRLTTKGGVDLLGRLNIIKADLTELVRLTKPHRVVVEDTRYIKQRSATTNAAMSGALMVCQHLAKAHGLGIYYVNPKSVKCAVTGDGKADKAKMMANARQHWHLKDNEVKDDNHADALCSAYYWLVQGPTIIQRQNEKHTKKKRKAVK